MSIPVLEDCPEKSEIRFTSRDEKILNSILGSEPYNLYPHNKIDSQLPPDPNTATKIVDRLKNLEKKALLLDQDQKTAQSLDILDHIIEENPSYCSAYTTRAKVLTHSKPLECPKERIIPDLEKAINLAKPKQINSKMSVTQAEVLHSAYTQLATIYLNMSKLPQNMRRAWDLQIDASEMLVEASIYGELVQDFRDKH